VSFGVRRACLSLIKVPPWDVFLKTVPENADSHAFDPEVVGVNVLVYPLGVSKNLVVAFLPLGD
jgi:hypothetical protein